MLMPLEMIQCPKCGEPITDSLVVMEPHYGGRFAFTEELLLLPSEEFETMLRRRMLNLERACRRTRKDLQDGTKDT